MAIRVEKPAFNMREKLTELDSASIPYERMPKGSIIQVQHKYFPGYTSVGTNNSPIKFFDLNIYPKRKRSKFLVNAIIYYSHGGMGAANADSYDYFFFLYNNEQPIHQNILTFGEQNRESKFSKTQATQRRKESNNSTSNNSCTSVWAPLPKK